MPRDRNALPFCEPYYTRIIARSFEIWHEVNGIPTSSTPYRWYWLLQDVTEYSYILRLIDWWKPKKVLEIGYGYGGSAICLRLLLPHALIVHVDIDNYISPKTTHDKVLTGHNVAKWLMSQGKWVFLWCDSTNPSIAEYLRLRFGLFDLLIIDGNHTYNYVKSDYLLYSTVVRKGGLIVFHDSRKEHQLEGSYDVRRVISDLKLRGYEVYNYKADRTPGLFWAIKGIER